MTPACASCAAELSADARFCSACGAPVEEPAPREARKVVSALFADVVGSTQLGERMDPEDFKGVIGGAVGRMASAVERFGGEVFEYAGDGLLALFGAPVAHEDDPERAILAGLEIVDSIAAESDEIAREWKIETFAVRVGIETGLAVLGPVGEGRKLEYGAIGDALNTAARLQAAAEPGAVLVGPRTHRLTRERFDFGEPLELDLKGKTEPVIAHGARRPRPTEGPDGRGVGAELVGREEELRRGLESIEEVLAGSGGILFVTGDAGIGKSRLVSELRRRFVGGESPGGEPRWLEGRCVSYGEALPYWPFRGLLREWLGELADESGAAGVPGALAQELDRLAPERAGELVEPLGLVLRSGGGREGTDSSDPPPQVIQERIRAAVAELFDRLAAEGPVVLALDDLHWADASSMALLDRLLELAERAPILLVLVARPERGHPVWNLREHALRELAHRSREAALEALTSDRDHELLAALVGADTLPAELQRRLLARAEGNPFYLEELVRSMAESGSLRRRGEGWAFDSEVPVEIPETVEKLILARIDRLSPPAQRLVGVAAVLGRQFPVALLDAVTDGDAEEPLRELRAAEILRDAARWPVPLCAFRHTLIQETAYRGLLRQRRQELHGAAIAAIELLYADRIDEFAGMVAHHADVADDDRRSLDYHRRAADAAARVYSVDEAIEHYDGALAAAERMGLADTDADVRAMLFARGELRYSVGRLDESRRDFELVIAAAQDARDSELEVEASLGLVSYWRSRDFARATELIEATVRASEEVAPLPRVNALARLAIQYVQQLRLDSAAEVGERALSLASAEGDRRSLDRAKDALKLVAQQLGDIERLEELTDDLLASLQERPEDSFYVPWVLLESAFVPLARGHWDEAEHRLTEALELTRTQGYRYQEPLFLDALCWLHRAKGDHGQAIEHGRSAAAIAHEHGGSEWASWTDASLGWALLEAGRRQEAVQCLERGLRSAEAGNPPAQLTRCVCLLACARSMLGERDSAGELATRGEQLLGRVSVPAAGAWLFGAHAYLAVARVRRDAGEDERAQAIAAPILAVAGRSGWSEALAGAALLA